MRRGDLLDRLGAIRRWKTGGQRAPHKPLLLLLALARLQRGEPRLVEFSEIEEPLRRLLVEFGPQRQSYHPEYPFWHLRSDGLWEVDGDDELADRAKRDTVPVSVLRAGASGGFPREVHDALAEDASTFALAVQTVLDEHFAPSLHDDLLAAVGLTGAVTSAASKRDPQFRLEVLRAYEYRCAMCGYDAQLETVSLGVDAAHVRWWAHGGPDTLDNGLALCALHHRVFDGGGVTVSLDRSIEVSRLVRGAGMTRRLLTSLHGKPLGTPQAGLPGLRDGFLRWHHREVFKGPARALAAAEEDAAFDI